MKNFGEWMNSMAGSIEDASTFTKDITKASSGATLHDFRQLAWYNCVATLGGEPKTMEDLVDFTQQYMQMLFGNNELIVKMEILLSDEDAKQWTEEFKEWLMK